MKILWNLYIKHKETTHNFFWRNVQILSKGGVFFLIFIISAKFLSPERFGILNYLLAVLALFIIFCDFGLSTATSKYVAEFKTLDPEKVNKTLFSVSAPVICISSVIALLVILFGKHVFRENHTYLLMFLPYLFLVPLTSTLDGFHRGLKKFRRLGVIHLVIGILTFFISFFLIKNYLLPGAILSLNILYFLLTSCLYFSAKGTEFILDRDILKKIGKYALLIGLANISYFMYTRIDILIMKQFNYTVEIGYYGLIDKLFGMIFIPAVILGQVLAPNIARYAALRDFSSIKIKFTKYFYPILGLSIPFSLAIYMIFPAFLKTFLPQYYTLTFLSIFKILLLLLPFKIWGAFSVNGFITPAGFAKIITLWTSIGGVLNIILDYIFIRIFGFIGVFLVTLIIHSCVIFISTLIFYRKIRSIRS
ncbi:MAG: oligosaccharide flippase family protein [Candidatus Omnitrophota bacterium]|nr:oligosaccharide flippase family protein [Candidatus Omnitrophota bacterium]